MTTKRKLDDTSVSKSLKKAKTDDEKAKLQHIEFREIKIIKNGNEAEFYFRICYKFAPVFFYNTELFRVSVINDNSISDGLKDFVNSIEKDESSTLLSNKMHEISYDSDKKVWLDTTYFLDNNVGYFGVNKKSMKTQFKIKLDEESRLSMVKAFRVHIIDKIKRHMEI